MKASISDGSDFLLCIRMASAPALRYASARLSASSSPHPAINASTLAATQKSGSVCESVGRDKGSIKLYNFNISVALSVCFHMSFTQA